MGRREEKRLIAFARKNNISALFRGVDPEENRRVYYFLTGKNDEVFENKLTRLSYKVNSALMSLPISLEQAREQDLQNDCLEKCIYKNDKSLKSNA